MGHLVSLQVVITFQVWEGNASASVWAVFLWVNNSQNAFFPIWRRSKNEFGSLVQTVLYIFSSVPHFRQKCILYSYSVPFMLLTLAHVSGSVPAWIRLFLHPWPWLPSYTVFWMPVVTKARPQRIGNAGIIEKKRRGRLKVHALKGCFVVM